MQSLIYNAGVVNVNPHAARNSVLDADTLEHSYYQLCKPWFEC